MDPSFPFSDGTLEDGGDMNEGVPRVSVITPAFNRTSLLEETILSVLGQDYPNVEYIVLDDGSEDGTLEVIRKFQDRLRWDSHVNMGETRTVNKGFSMAEGDIIGVVNSDDPLLPGAVSKAVKLLLQKPDVVVVYPDWRVIDAEGSVIESIVARDFESASDTIRRHHCLPGPGAFFRRQVVVSLGGRDEQLRYVGDLDFWFRAGLLGRFERIPETLATWRIHPDSATVGPQGALMADEHVRVVDKLYARPDLPAAVTSSKREAYSSAYYMAGCSCGRGPLLKATYFFRAVGSAPLKYLGEYMGRLVMMLLVLVGMSTVHADLFLRRLAKPFKSRRRTQAGDPSPASDGSRDPRSTSAPRENPDTPTPMKRDQARSESLLR